MKLLRALGRQLLFATARFTPESERAWAEAMLGEFEAIDEDGAAFRWSLGSALTLLRMCLASRLRTEWERGITMARIFVAVSVLLLLVLWVATPVVRQGVSLVCEVWSTEWYAKNWREITQKDVDRVRADARSQSDPEALAYLALNEKDPSNADLLIAEAVKRDAKLGWVYGVLAKPHGEDAQSSVWVQKAREYDPTNALPSLLAARNIRVRPPLNRRNGRIEDDEEWRLQMKAAFAATSYNDYLRERMDLQRHVMKKYGVGGPMSLLATIYQFPVYPFYDISHYTDKLIVEGNRTGDLSKYREVIDFSERLYLGANSDIEQYGAKQSLRRTMAILAPKLDAEGKHEEAAILAFQAEEIRKDTKSAIENGDEYLLRNGGVVHLATLFAVLAAVGAIFTIVAAASGRLLAKRVRGAWAITTGCVMVLLTSLATVYVSYSPYEEMYREFVNGRMVSPKLLAEFGSIVDVPFFLFRTTPSTSIQVMVWQLVIVTCFLGLVGIGLRHVTLWRKTIAR